MDPEEKKKPEYKTIGTRLPTHEAILVELYCKRKGVTPSSLIRELLLKQIDISIPNNVAGNNMVTYNRENDTYSWSILLDNKETVEVIANMSTQYIEELSNKMNKAIQERNLLTDKRKLASVAIPGRLIQ